MNKFNLIYLALAILPLKCITITTEKCTLGTDMEDLLQWNG